MRVEPVIKVGICTGREVRFRLNGRFRLGDLSLSGIFSAAAAGREIRVCDETGRELWRRAEVFCRAEEGATFTVYEVTIGIDFHWERKQEETFCGDLRFIAPENDRIAVINEIGLEAYLASVISSEMNAAAPFEFLQAHAVISRSWLAAMLGRREEKPRVLTQTERRDGEIIRWYDREDHDFFDVCADDHCQRYQGIGGIRTGRAAEAVLATRGMFLLKDDEICDARYHKACGGLTENFATAWEDKKISYLASVPDSMVKHPPVRTETEAKSWILSFPDAYCHTKDGQILRQVLPAFDQETADFFRWQVAYSRTELEEIIGKKAGMDVGVLYDLVPLMRGPSGRIFRLQIRGSKTSFIVGKELEIRRLLSPSHLFSSAFVVSVERDTSGLPARFILHGAGWGHGVGLCQVGAAVMAAQGFEAAEILTHYFCGASLKRLYL
jgi:stage II sporulation protein D